MTERPPGGPRRHAFFVLSVVASVVAAVALFLAPYLYVRVNDVADQNREFICSLGDLVQLSGGPSSDAIQGPLRHLKAELDFLTSIHEANCPLIVKYPAIDAKVEHTIILIEVEIERRAK